MSDLLYTDPLTQQTVPLWMSQAVDDLLYKVRQKNIWEIVEFAIKFWARKNPIEHKKYLDAVQEHKLSRKNKFASTKEKQLRELVHIPSDISYILDKIASHKIEEYGRLKFYKEFARRYPGFRGGEVL